MSDRRGRNTSPVGNGRTLLRSTRTLSDSRKRFELDAKPRARSRDRDRSPIRREPETPRGSNLITSLNVINDRTDTTESVVSSAMAWAQQRERMAAQQAIGPEQIGPQLVYYEDPQKAALYQSAYTASANGAVAPYYESSMAIDGLSHASLLPPTTTGMVNYAEMTMGQPITQDQANALLADPTQTGLHNFNMPLYEAHMSEIHPGILNKEIVRTENLVLHPPAPNTQQRTLREKPPGCKTVFVGGIPEKSTEENIREIFEKCGKIQQVRMSKKQFCHVKYTEELYVDFAILLSGWRVRIDDSSDAAMTGRLHVDYADARDDHHEYMCKLRAMERAERHRRRSEGDSGGGAGVKEVERRKPDYPSYNDKEATHIADRLKTDHPSRAMDTLHHWLEKGELTSRTVARFYSMLQATNSQVRRLVSEQGELEDEYAAFKEKLYSRHQSILSQLQKLDAVFSCASKQKNWDRFTKAQRKNIEAWRTQAQIVCRQQLDHPMFAEKGEADMDVEDMESVDQHVSILNPQAHPAPAVPTEHKGVQTVAASVDPSRVFTNQQLDTESEVRLASAQQQLVEARREKVEVEMRLEAVNAQLSDALVALEQYKGMSGHVIPLPPPPPPAENDMENDMDTGVDMVQCGSDDDSNHLPAAHPPPVVKREPPAASLVEHAGGKPTTHFARLIGLVSTFLVVHPFGASVEYIWSYISRSMPLVSLKETEEVLSAYPDLFTCQLVGEGARIERRWLYLGFELPPAPAPVGAGRA